MLFCFRGMPWASVVTESLRLWAWEDPLQLRNLFACGLCEPVQVKEEREHILMARVLVVGLVSLIVRGHHEVGFAGGNNPEVADPYDLLVPVDVKRFLASVVKEGLQNVDCIFGGTVLEAFVCTLVGCHPCSFAGAWDDVLVFVLCLALSQSSPCILARQRAKEDVTGRGPSAVDNHISDSIGNAKGLKQLPCFMFNLFTSGVRVPATNDESIPVCFRIS